MMQHPKRMPSTQMAPPAWSHSPKKMTKTKTIATAAPGRKPEQGNNYTKAEVMSLLDISQRVLPIGSEEWQCADEHGASEK